MDYDAVIAGAGPVGLLLACELGLAGVRTVVLERLSDPNLPTRAAGLGGRGLNIASMEAFYRRGLMDGILLDPLLQDDRHGVACFLPDHLAKVGSHWQFMPAVAQGHKGALEWMTINLAPDLNQTASTKELD